MIKLSVKDLNKFTGYPLPGGESRIYIRYSRPQKFEDKISVFVDGYLTSPSSLDDKNKKIKREN